MDDQAAHRRAALAGGAHRAERDGAQRQVEIGRRRDDRGVVAAEFEDAAGKAARQPLADDPPHAGRAGRREDRHALVVDQRLANRAAANQHGQQVVRRVGAEPGRRATVERLDRQRRQRRLLRRFPHHRVAANEGQRGVPRPHGDREVERRNDADDASRPPGFNELVIGALGLDREAVELTRQADGEVADVDHLLHFAETFRLDLADLDRHQPTEFGFGGAQFLGEQADKFAPARRRDAAPFEEGGVAAADRRFRIRHGRFVEPRQRPAVDRRMDDELRALEALECRRRATRGCGGLRQRAWNRGRERSWRISTVWRRRGD